MKVLYDHQTFSLQEYGGISRIYTELLRPDYKNGFNAELSLVFSNNAYLSELQQIHYFNFLKKSSWKYKVPAMYNLNKQYSIHKVKAGHFDVFHPTYYDPYFVKFLKGKPFVVTVLDMIHEKLVDRYKNFALDKIVPGKKQLLKEASRVIAISESTKNDIVEVFGTDRNKIDVIYLGSSMEKQDNEKIPRQIEGDYILFIGKRDEYKNFGFFLEAIIPLLNQQKDLKVVCGGGGQFIVAENNLIERLGMKGRVVSKAIKDDLTFISLYSNAVCFVFPSLYEGFGIPVLEAFSCGCACALSNRSSLPEVGGDAVVYFDPEDAESILQGVSKLVTDEAFRKEKIAKGYQRLSLFSWSKTREQTFKLYSELV
jgi:glycosyltransferase involved in cell wall biosynthesis